MRRDRHLLASTGRRLPFRYCNPAPPRRDLGTRRRLHKAAYCGASPCGTRAIRYRAATASQRQHHTQPLPGMVRPWNRPPSAYLPERCSHQVRLPQERSMEIWRSLFPLWNQTFTREIVSRGGTPQERAQVTYARPTPIFRLESGNLVSPEVPQLKEVLPCVTDCLSGCSKWRS